MRGHWLYGTHAALAAIANPARELTRILVTPEFATAREAALEAAADARGPTGPAIEVEIVDRELLDAMFGAAAVHQGIAIATKPLPQEPADDLAAALPPEGPLTVVVLDQVSDPQNVGAVLRSAGAFGAAGVLVPDRGSPEETPAMAKAASGALERVPLARASNLRRALELLKERGMWVVGLDGDGDAALGDRPLPARAVLVLGAEGQGLRPLTRQTCDLVLRIPIGEAAESLNVSNAAAVALYAWTSGREET